MKLQNFDIRKKDKKFLRRLDVFSTLIAVFVVVFSLGLPPMFSLAAPGEGTDGTGGSSSSSTTTSSGWNGYYNSWVRDKGDYSNSQLTTIPGYPDPKKTEATVDSDVGSLEKSLSELIASIGTHISKALRWEDGAGTVIIDGSTTGIIMGKVTRGTNWFVFDLTDNNIYGKAGAVVYLILRGLAFTLLFLLLLFSLVKTLWDSDRGKGLSAFKNTLYAGIIALFFMFLMPQIVDWLCEFRDVLCVAIYDGFEASSFTPKDQIGEVQGLEGQFYSIYSGNRSFASALLYCAACCVPFTYLISYVKIAVIQLILFGIFPMLALVSVEDKSILQRWAGTFISNLFIPPLDTALIMLPMMILSMFTQMFQNPEGEFDITFLTGLILVALMYGAIPARNAVLSMFGNTSGSVLNGGEGWAALREIGGRMMTAARGMAEGIKAGIDMAKDAPPAESGSGDTAPIGDGAGDGNELKDNEKSLPDASGDSPETGTPATGEDTAPSNGEGNGSSEGTPVNGNDENTSVNQGAPSGDEEGKAETAPTNLENGGNAEGSTGSTGNDTDGTGKGMDGNTSEPIEGNAATGSNDGAGEAGVNEDAGEVKPSKANELNGDLEPSINDDLVKEEHATKNDLPEEMNNAIQTRTDQIHGKDADTVEKKSDKELMTARGANISKLDKLQDRQKELNKEDRDSRKKIHDNNVAIQNNKERAEALKDTAFAPEMHRKRLAEYNGEISKNNKKIDELQADAIESGDKNKNNAAIYELKQTNATMQQMADKETRNYNQNKDKIESDALHAKQEYQKISQDTARRQEENNVENRKMEAHQIERESNQANIDIRKDRETAYAQAAKDAGLGDGHIYSNASSYTKSIERDARQAQAINYKNFRSKGVDTSVLTQREARRIQMQAALAVGAKGVVSAGIKGAVQVGTGVAGAVVSGYGGENAVRGSWQATKDAGEHTAEYLTDLPGDAGVLWESRDRRKQKPKPAPAPKNSSGGGSGNSGGDHHDDRHTGSDGANGGNGGNERQPVPQSMSGEQDQNARKTDKYSV